MNMACVKLIRESYGGWRQFPTTVEAFVATTSEIGKTGRN